MAKAALEHEGSSLNTVHSTLFVLVLSFSLFPMMKREGCCGGAVPSNTVEVTWSTREGVPLHSKDQWSRRGSSSRRHWRPSHGRVARHPRSLHYPLVSITGKIKMRIQVLRLGTGEQNAGRWGVHGFHPSSSAAANAASVPLYPFTACIHTLWMFVSMDHILAMVSIISSF